MQALKALVTRLLREAADKIDSGNCELSESEAMDIMAVLSHQAMSKAQVCKYLNTSSSNFGAMIRAKQMPKGRKVTGYNELRWYRDEIDDCIKKMEEGKITLQK